MLQINTVHHGDCLDLMKIIDDQSVQLILCDLPYNQTHNKWDSLIPFNDLWKEYKRILRPGGAVLLTAAGQFTVETINSNPEWYRYDWIWVKNRKTNFANAKRMPLRNHEKVLVFYPSLPIYNPQGIKPTFQKHKAGRKTGDSYNTPSLKQEYVQTQTGYPTDVLYFDSVVNASHPTEKPVALFEFLIRTYSDDGDLVLDNCAGSGTTGVAAKNCGRDFILIEKCQSYVEIAKQRVS